jgi:ABC-type proline/glycine betaine transport system permease subunit
MSDEQHQQPTNVAPSRVSNSPASAYGRPSAAPSAATPPAAPTPRAGISNLRFILAMGVAFLADTIGLPFGELGVFVFDVCVGLLLALCLRGFRPEILIACLIEAIPGVGLFPSWSLAVPALWARLRLAKGGEPPRQA